MSGITYTLHKIDDTTYIGNIEGKYVIIDIEKTALVDAVGNGRRDIVEYLLKNGEDPNYVDSNHGSLLYYAIMKRDVKMVKLLLEYGANVNVRNDQQPETLITLICSIYSPRALEMVKLLYDHGLVITEEDYHLLKQGDYNTATVMYVISKIPHNDVIEFEKSYSVQYVNDPEINGGYDVVDTPILSTYV